MRPLVLIVLAALITASPAVAQARRTEPQPTQPLQQTSPQTARQALLEMFIQPKPGALEKHLLDITRKMVMRGADPGKSDVLRAFIGFSAGFTANQKRFEKFDAGPILFSMEPAGVQQRIEVLVDSDDLLGDRDVIGLSLLIYKNGLEQPLPVLPEFMFTMEREQEIWKLDEIAVTLRMPLGNVDFLKGLKKMQNDTSETIAVASLRTLNRAETSYARTYTGYGFSCKISDLAETKDKAGPQPAMLNDPALATGSKGGYKFLISGCGSQPITRYQVAAVPEDSDVGLKAFCSDESGIVRSSADGTAASCLSVGVPVE